jgi:hypothetical protein
VVERAQVAGPEGTNRDLNRRVTMLHDQTTRSKLTARQATGRDRNRLAPISGRGRIGNPILIAATVVVGLNA